MTFSVCFLKYGFTDLQSLHAKSQAMVPAGLLVMERTLSSEAIHPSDIAARVVAGMKGSPSPRVRAGNN